MPKERPFVGSDYRFILYLIAGESAGVALGIISSQHLAAGLWMALLGIIVFLGYRFKELPVAEMAPRVEYLPPTLQERARKWIENFNYCRDLIRWTGNICFTCSVIVIYCEALLRFRDPFLYPLGWMLAGIGCASRLVLPKWAREADGFYHEMNRLIQLGEEKRKVVNLEGGSEDKSQGKKKSPTKSTQTLEDLIPRSKSIEEDMFRDKLLAISSL